MLDKLSEILNAPEPIQYGGKTYDLRKADVEQMGEFCTFVETRAVQAVERMYANGLDPANKPAHLAALAGEFAAGKYEFGGEYVDKALRTRTGKRRLLWIMLRREHPDLIEQMCDGILDAHTDLIERKVTEMIADPKVLSALAVFARGETAFGG